MRFLGSKFTQNALTAGAPPRTPLGELKRSSLPISGSRFAGMGKGKESKEGGGKEEKGYWGKERGREGKGREEGREGKGKEEGKGGEGEFASLALEGIDAPDGGSVLAVVVNFCLLEE